MSEINDKSKEIIQNHSKCQICSKLFTTEYKLRCHIKTHKKTITCQFCNASFTDPCAKFRLKYHLFTKHLTNLPYKCPNCNKGFDKQSSVKRHIKNTHTGKFPYVCNICKRACRMKSAYEVHMLIHNKERPHICNECNASFKCKAGLSVHWQYKHSNIQYICTACNKLFKTKIGLKKHSIRLHNNIVKFSTQNLKNQKRQKDVNSLIIEIPTETQQINTVLQPQLFPLASPLKGWQGSQVTSQPDLQPSPSGKIPQGQQKSNLQQWEMWRSAFNRISSHHRSQATPGVGFPRSRQTDQKDLKDAGTYDGRNIHVSSANVHPLITSPVPCESHQQSAVYSTQITRQEISSVHKIKPQEKIKYYICPFCSKVCDSKLSFKNHIGYDVTVNINEYIVNNNIKCQICNIDFDEYNSYNRHVVNHDINGFYSCSQCQIMYKSICELNRHQIFRRHFSDYTKCSNCKLLMPNQFSLRNHIWNCPGRYNK